MIEIKFREIDIKGNIVYEKNNKEKVEFLEDILNGRFIVKGRTTGETTWCVGVDPYSKTENG